MKHNPNANTPDMMSRLYWNGRAAEYALPFEEENLARTNRIIGIAESKGLSIEGARILDIGSGPGTFALPLSLRGASVTALDISDSMLRLLSEEAQRVGIERVRTIRASWKEIDPVVVGLSGMFDTVLSAFSSAIETENEILKMEQCSRRWCVYIASGRTRHDKLCKTIRQGFGLPLNPRPDIRNTLKTLEQMDKVFWYESHPVTVQAKKTVAEIAEYVARSLEEEGKTPDQPQILAAISAASGISEQNGVIECKRHSNIGVLMWRVDERW
ncbi:MAG: Mg-protoporphyrin IX methyl transferase [Syntrophorhabdus sp. PtaU1.Bin002]|nr:MAG: Mg-protoporphyrin IX methyl transferase [Syntrophorhabdus sp. PtaB.Bin006]OPY71323.1 MAG: Mg-protoporphyrin IX methyl transferase [Syntrophorhabdus sp. PtaU1.Bin002]